MDGSHFSNDRATIELPGVCAPRQNALVFQNLLPFSTVKCILDGYERGSVSDTR